MRILIVDDMETRRTQFKKWYASEHTLTICEDGHAAFKALRDATERFDVVFLDHDLADDHYQGSFGAEPSGYDVCKFIVTELPKERYPKVAVIHSWNPDGAKLMQDLLFDYGITAVRLRFEPGPSFVELHEPEDG